MKKNKFEVIEQLKVGDIKIVLFYLFQCPVKGLVAGANSFKKLKWVNSNEFKQLKKKMIASSSSLEKTNFLGKSSDELQQSLKKCDEYGFLTEWCVFSVGENGEISSLYRAIRNAIAHGSFSRKKKGKEIYYYFENYNKDIKRASIHLKGRTLENWITIVKEGPKN